MAGVLIIDWRITLLATVFNRHRHSAYGLMLERGAGMASLNYICPVVLCDFIRLKWHLDFLRKARKKKRRPLTGHITMN